MNVPSVLAVDGGTAWLSRESILLESDDVDGMFSGTDSWQSLAAQLKQDLASIIQLSDAELQVNVPATLLPEVSTDPFSI